MAQATVASVIDAVEWRMVDAIDNSYTDEQIIDLLNDGLKDLSETNYFINEQTVALTAESTIDVQTKFTYQMRKAYGVSVGGTRLYYSPYHEMQSTSGSGTPVWWSWRGANINLSTAFTGNVLILYAGVAPDVAAGGSLDSLSSPHSNTLAAYVEYRLRQGEQDFSGADRALSEYNALKLNLSVRTQEELITGGYGV